MRAAATPARRRDANAGPPGPLAGALRPLSDDTAAGDATGNAVGDGYVRPRLHQQARTSGAEAVVAQLIGSGRAGCARCCGARRASSVAG